jgi:hypothetical protein
MVGVGQRRFIAKIQNHNMARRHVSKVTVRVQSQSLRRVVKALELPKVEELATTRCVILPVRIVIG